MCAIAASRDGEPTRTREVVELVSIFYRPAPTPPSESESANEERGATAPTDEFQTASPEPSMRARVRVRASEALPKQGAVPARSATASKPKVIKVTCRPPKCRDTYAARAPVSKSPGAKPGQQAEPPLPAALVPIRKLGLYLQSRMDSAPERKADVSKDPIPVNHQHRKCLRNCKQPLPQRDAR
jgi:hypothetical protein